MRGRELKQALQRGEYVFGTALEGYGQPRWPRFFAQIGLDFVFMDTEHTPQNRETIAWAAQAYAANQIAPLVRLPRAEATEAAIALDLGAHGVIAPYVESVEQAKEMIGAVKYRPLKGEALRRALNEGIFPDPGTAQYLAKYNEDCVLIVMIESPAGAANLDSILALGQIDGVLIGPHDFSISSGRPEGYDDPKFIEAVDRIIHISKTHNVGVGFHVSWGDLEEENHWLRKGCNFVLHSSDTACFSMNMAAELNSLRRRLGLPDSGSVTVYGRKGHSSL